MRGGRTASKSGGKPASRVARTCRQPRGRPNAISRPTRSTRPLIFVNASVSTPFNDGRRSINIDVSQPGFMRAAEASREHAGHSVTAVGCEMSMPGPRSAVAIIRHEHTQLSTVIDGMRHFVRLLVAGEPVPGVIVFRAMLYYIREYPQRIHHPNEDRYLFAPLRARTGEFDSVLDQLEAQHDKSDMKLRNLEHALTRYELKGASALHTLGALMDDYAEFHADHRCLEETVILPAATRVLTPDDWVGIDAAFAANRDPFDGQPLDEDLDRLFSMIVQAIPDRAPD